MAALLDGVAAVTLWLCTAWFSWLALAGLVRPQLVGRDLLDLIASGLVGAVISLALLPILSDHRQDERSATESPAALSTNRENKR